MKLFVYDHCPYCVRTRMPFAMKNIPLELIELDNADEATPISMIGTKACPILEKADGTFTGESMDIVKYLDALDGSPIFAPSAERTELKEWITNNSVLFRQLLYPRWVNSPLGEFKTQAGRDYFTNKKEKDIGPFAEALAKTDVYQKELEVQLIKLAALLHSETSVNECLSLDDIDVFGRLRAITLIKGLVIPAKIRAYIDHFSAITDIPTYDNIAQ
ncbi:MAG: glutaredoxin 2 [Thalassotalea sp.]